MLPELSNVLEPVLIPITPETEPIHITSVDENQDSIFLHPFELAQNFENHLDILASYSFSENLSLKVILSLKLVIPFYFLIQ